MQWSYLKGNKSNNDLICTLNTIIWFHSSLNHHHDVSRWVVWGAPRYPFFFAVVSHKFAVVSLVSLWNKLTWFKIAVEYIKENDVISDCLVFVNKLLWNTLTCSGRYCRGFSLTDLSRLTSPKNWFLHNATFNSPRLAQPSNPDWLMKNLLCFYLISQLWRRERILS